jgi:Ser/Thr protein kinase RdoA (MazF antagonist)
VRTGDERRADSERGDAAREALDAIDPHEIMRTLGFSGRFSATPLAQNRGKGVWRMDGDAGTFALRVLRGGESESALHEQEAMEVARAAGVPVPEVPATGTWRERPVLLLSWLGGQTLHDAVRARPWSAYRMGAICGRRQARLNQVLPPPSLDGTRWLTRFGPLDPELLARLESIDAPPGLLHLDFHPGNVLVAGGELRGLVDWTNACAGDPRADLARTWSLLVCRPAGGGPKARAAAVVLKLLAAGWHRGYEQVAGRQEDMLLFRIWALTGLAQTTSSEVDRFGSAPMQGSFESRLAELRCQAGLSPRSDEPSGPGQTRR